MTDERRNMTIDECTRSGKCCKNQIRAIDHILQHNTENQECSRPYSNLIPFFCGSSKVCQKRNDEALEIAKQNVRNKYTIVGIMEDFPTTMKALESLIPRFFMGANVLYDKANQALHEHSKTAHRKGNFRLEVKF